MCDEDSAVEVDVLLNLKWQYADSTDAAVLQGKEVSVSATIQLGN